MLIVLVIPAVLMIGALLMERLERIMFSPKASTSDTDADR